MTKSFTATAVLQQVAAGALSLDDTVRDVLPIVAAALPPTAAITVRQLPDMSSRLPDYSNPPSTVLGELAKAPHTFFTPALIADSSAATGAAAGHAWVTRRATNCWR